MTRQELDFFLALRDDYRRDAFMTEFWKPRDPDRTTPRNELRDRWEQYRREAGSFPYGDPRFLLYLLNGPPGGWSLPDGRPAARCFSRSRDFEIWFYDGSERTTQDFVVVFQRLGVTRPYEIYYPGGRFDPIQRTGGLPSEDIRLLCADELLRYAVAEMQRIGGYSNLLTEVMTPPLPSPEWLANFSASSTELPPGAETFAVDVDLAFPARNQSRTAVKVVLGVPRESAPGREFEGTVFHDFLLTGEVIREGSLFETFRYRFEGPTPEDAARIPIGFTRFLRSGPATLKLLLEDVFGHRYAHVERELDVPSPDGLPAVVDDSAPAEAAPLGPTLRLATPASNVLAGKVRFRASAEGEMEKVTYFLDDKPVFTKRDPPYSVELDLGSDVAPHRVRVVGYVGEDEVATDQIWLNQGSQRFRVRLIEPRSGGLYPGSLTARVEVDTPDGGPPERLDLYLNDERVATLREPPFAQSLRLPNEEVAVVRAVAYLADGTSTEDAVLVNASPFTETVEVRLVDLAVSVTDGEGRPLTGLRREQFEVFEDDVPQTLQRFEEASDAPVQLALLLDRSISMAPHLDAVAGAALGFAKAALRTPDDQVAVFSFAGELSADAAFTDSALRVERALAGLVALGGTAFYDSLVQTLNNFDGVSGHTALVVFSDGEDESSRLTFEQALEAARRAGVTIYSLGLAEAFPERSARRVLEDLAVETGGRAFFLGGVDELPRVYDAILKELGTRYLIAYQPAAGPPGEFREIRVEVEVRGARVRTRLGYYP
jgi:Ca-activated chloride channel family protein